MLLKIAKLSSSLDKNNWHFKCSNEFFQKIITTIIKKLDFEYVEVMWWSKEISLFSSLKYEKSDENKKFTTIKMGKENCIRFIDSNLFHELRLFEFNTFSKVNKLFSITSDNYGEYTTIMISKLIDENSLSELLDDINRLD